MQDMARLNFVYLNTFQDTLVASLRSKFLIKRKLENKTMVRFNINFSVRDKKCRKELQRLQEKGLIESY
jgi:hypothetical protein